MSKGPRFCLGDLVLGDLVGPGLLSIGPEYTTVQAFTDDAHRLLATLGTEAAFVLGDSSGGLVGLELVSQRSE